MPSLPMPSPPPRHIEGYAIISEDGMLANAQGIMPEALKFDADKRFFEDGLDRVDVVVHGRHSHEKQPHSALRQRVLVTDQIPALAPDPSNEKAVFWNPKGVPFEEALAALKGPAKRIAIIGGTGVFGMFLDSYDVFYLTHAPGVRLPHGRPVFPGVPAQSPDAILTHHGLHAQKPQILDAAKKLIMVAWTRA